MKMALKFARTVDFKVRLKAHEDSQIDNDELRFHRNTWARNFTLSVFRTPKGVHVEVDKCGRCLCELVDTVEKLNARSETVAEAFGRIVTWVKRNMPGELGRNYKWSKACESCGGTVPYLGPHATSKRWDSLGW